MANLGAEIARAYDDNLPITENDLSQRMSLATADEMLVSKPWIADEIHWRKRVGVEPTGDRITCRPPVLKTGAITGSLALPR